MKMFLVYEIGGGYTNRLIGWPYPDNKRVLFSTREGAIERIGKNSNLMVVELELEVGRWYED